MNPPTRPGSRMACAILLAMIALPASAHPTTEQFVPIGYWASVGRSDIYAGTLAAVATATSELSFTLDGRRRTVRVGPTTRIYVDRSHLSARSRTGTLADCVAGRTVEIKFSAQDPTLAEWVKVRAER